MLFCGLLKAQTDTARISPPKPDNTQDTQKQPEPTPTNTVATEPIVVPTPTVAPKEEPSRKRPKGYNDYVNKGKRPADATPFTDNIYYGCNLQLGYYGTSYGNVLYYDISPHVGYKFNEVLSAGIQVIYNNQSYTSGTQHFNYNIFGTGGFGRVLVLNRFFLQVEYDILSIPATFLGNSILTRALSDEKMAGIGYKSPLGDKLSYFFVLLYDIQPGPNSPYLYNPLVYRAGISWNF